MLVCPWQTLQEQIKEKIPFQIQKQETIQKSEEKEISLQREKQEVSEHIQNQVMALGNPALSRTGIVPSAGTAGLLRAVSSSGNQLREDVEGLEQLGGLSLGSHPCPSQLCIPSPVQHVRKCCWMV